MRKFAMLVTLPALVALAGCEIDGSPNYVRPQFTPEAGGAGYTPTPPPPVDRSFTILHTNDEHSHLLGFGPNIDYPFLPAAGETGDGVATTVAVATAIGTGADQQTVGGFARRDYLLNKLRMEATDPVLTISAGDSTMGTFFQMAGTILAPDWLAMNLAGYDYMTLGNHEFDFGPDALALTIQAGSNASFGGIAKIIASNINFDDVEMGGAGYLLSTQYGEGGSGALVQPWDVKVLANGLRVGLIGAMGYHAAFVAAGRPPISFSVPSDGAACTESATCTGLESCVQGHCVDPQDALPHIAAAAADLQPHIDTLRNEQMVDVVVLISHMGTEEDYAVAGLTTGIDVIIGGHSHDALLAHVIDGTTTILAQAGNYGKALGQTTVTVAVDGTISLDDTRSALHTVDYTLDAEIVAGTSLPDAVSPALERAVSVTLGVVGPVAGELGTSFSPLLDSIMPWRTWTGIFDIVAVNPHGPITGGAKFQDHNLLHLVTDAELAVVGGSSCVPASSIATIALQANGVVRDSLYFSQVGDAASLADVFRVVPQGISPYEHSSVRGPGYSMVMFQMLAIEMLAGFEVGVTNGLESDDFFLSYAGAQVEYDTTRTPFMEDPTQGLITKISIGTDAGYPWVMYDASRSALTQWREADNTTPFNPQAALVTIISNFYLGSLMDKFGLAPRDATGTVVSVENTAMCWAGQAADCGATVPTNLMMPCYMISDGFTPPWTVPASDPVEGIPEVKEWEALVTYLNAPPPLLNGTIPAIYVGDTPAVSRVIDVTP